MCWITEEMTAHKNRTRGYTLIEVLITMAIMAVVSGLVYPQLNDLINVAPATTMAYTARQIRQQIDFHGQVGDCDVNEHGFPEDIDPMWFPMGRLPSDPWTHRPLKVQVVSSNQDEPNNRTFNIKSNSHTAWYSTRTGSFVIMVPDVGSEDEINELYQMINNPG